MTKSSKVSDRRTKNSEVSDRRTKNKLYTGITKSERHFEVFLEDAFFIELMEQDIANYTNIKHKIKFLSYKDIEPVYIVKIKNSEPKSLIINILKVYPIKRPVYYNHYGYGNGEVFLSKGIPNVDENLKEYIEKDKRLNYFFELENNRFYSREPELVFSNIEKAIEYIKDIYE